MKTLYMKPLSMDRLMDLSELVALYKNTTNDIINIGYPGIAPYKPKQGNMFGFNESTDKALFIARDSFKDSEIEEPVYEVVIDEDSNVVIDSKNISGYGYELETFLAGDPVVIKKFCK